MSSIVWNRNNISSCIINLEIERKRQEKKINITKVAAEDVEDVDVNEEKDRETEIISINATFYIIRI